MKRTLSLLVLVMVSLVLCFKITSEVSAEEINDDFLHDDLAEGETVVDFWTETIPNDEVVDNSLPFYPTSKNLLNENPSDGSLITPDARTLRWYTVSKTRLKNHSYSGWMYAGASTISGGTLCASHSKSVSNTYTGSLAVPLKTLESYIGFNINKSWDKSVSYCSKEYSSGKYRLEYRHVYVNYRVKQEKKYDSRGKVYETKYVYPKKWAERQYRVVSIK